jgi:ligand-binding sensor domain-containing protein
LSDDHAHDLYQDREGVLWIGTDEGLNLYDPRQTQFAHYRHDPGNPNTLSDNTVWRIDGDDTGILWIGAGLTLNRLVLRPPGSAEGFEPANGRVTRYSLESSLAQMIDPQTKVVYSDPDGFVWVGFGSILGRFNVERASFTAYDLQNTQPPNAPPMDIASIYDDGEGILWIGATRGGLVRFDKQSETFQVQSEPPEEPRGTPDPRFFIGHDFSTIYGDRAGNIWIGYTGGELSRFDPSASSGQAWEPPLLEILDLPGLEVYLQPMF